MFCQEKPVIFYFGKLTETWYKGNSPPSFELKEFEQAELCVIRCLKQYLSITNPLRCGKTTQLLISHITPHNVVSVDTEFLVLTLSIFTS